MVVNLVVTELCWMETHQLMFRLYGRWVKRYIDLKLLWNFIWVIASIGCPLIKFQTFLKRRRKKYPIWHWKRGQRRTSNVLLLLGKTRHQFIIKSVMNLKKVLVVGIARVNELFLLPPDIVSVVTLDNSVQSFRLNIDVTRKTNLSDCAETQLQGVDQRHIWLETVHRLSLIMLVSWLVVTCAVAFPSATTLRLAIMPPISHNLFHKEPINLAKQHTH